MDKCGAAGDRARPSRGRPCPTALPSLTRWRSRRPALSRSVCARPYARPPAPAAAGEGACAPEPLLPRPAPRRRGPYSPKAADVAAAGRAGAGGGAREGERRAFCSAVLEGGGGWRKRKAAPSRRGPPG